MPVCDPERISNNDCVVGLVVRISAFQADGPGSIPGQRIRISKGDISSSVMSVRHFLCVWRAAKSTIVPLAQWLERRSYEPDVAGSNPAWNKIKILLTPSKFKTCC